MRVFCFVLLALTVVSCGPSRDEALVYYEKILTATYPVEKSSVAVTGVVYLYTQDHVKGNQPIEAIQVEAIRNMNNDLLKKIEVAKVTLADVPDANYGSNLKATAQKYIEDMERVQKAIAGSVLPPLMNGGIYNQKDKVIEEVNYLYGSVFGHTPSAFGEMTTTGSSYNEAKISFEKGNNLYDFDRKQIEEKLEKVIKL